MTLNEAQMGIAGIQSLIIFYENYLELHFGMKSCITTSPQLNLYEHIPKTTKQIFFDTLLKTFLFVLYLKKYQT